jgi:hypothetical protein
MAPSLEQRKDLLKTSGWQIADVVVWGRHALDCIPPRCEFLPSRSTVYPVRLTQHFAMRGGHRNEQSLCPSAWLGFRLAAATLLLLTLQPHGRAACVVAIGPWRPISYKDLTSAFGAKRKWTGSQNRLDPSKMTHLRHCTCGQLPALTSFLAPSKNAQSRLLKADEND